MSSRLRKQSRLFCGHCKEYLLRATFWRHRRRYYNVQSESWTTGDDFEQEQMPKRAKPDHTDHVSREDKMANNAWPSDSSGDEDCEPDIFIEGMVRDLNLKKEVIFMRRKILVLFVVILYPGPC